MSNEARAKSWYPDFTLAYTTTGAPAVVKTWPVAAGEEITVGMPVVLDSNEVKAATSTSGTLYGISAGNGVGDDDDEVTVIVGDRNNVFMGRGNASTDGVTSIPEEADIEESDGHWRANIGTSTEGVLTIIDINDTDDDSDSTEPGRVYFQIKRSSYDGLVEAK